DAGRHRSTDTVDWTIEDYPEVELTATTDPMTSDPIQVDTTTPGTASVTWTYSTDDEEQTATVDITPAGTAGHTHDGEITYHP
ncbi:hypothetical protein, partial [Halostreptopolyspora alba]